VLKTCDSVSRFLGDCSTEEIFRKFRKSFAKCIIAIKALCQMKRQPPKSFVEASSSSSLSSLWSSSSFGSSFAGRSVLEVALCTLTPAAYVCEDTVWNFEWIGFHPAFMFVQHCYSDANLNLYVLLVQCSKSEQFYWSFHFKKVKFWPIWVA